MQSTSKFFVSLLLIACVGLTGCYQAKVTTNKSAGSKVVEKKWASSFLYGLVPAKIDVSNKCPNGIASAKRKISFVNGLVSSLTLNLYLPQTVKVTCAAGGSMSSSVPTRPPEFTVSSNATDQRVNTTLSEAAMQAALSQNPVEVRVATN